MLHVNNTCGAHLARAGNGASGMRNLSHFLDFAVLDFLRHTRLLLNLFNNLRGSL